MTGPGYEVISADRAEEKWSFFDIFVLLKFYNEKNERKEKIQLGYWGAGYRFQA